jgi:hypothetical protein
MNERLYVPFPTCHAQVPHDLLLDLLDLLDLRVLLSLVLFLLSLLFLPFQSSSEHYLQISPLRYYHLPLIAKKE